MDRATLVAVATGDLIGGARVSRNVRALLFNVVAAIAGNSAPRPISEGIRRKKPVHSTGRLIFVMPAALPLAAGEDACVIVRRCGTDATSGGEDQSDHRRPQKQGTGFSELLQ